MIAVSEDEWLVNDPDEAALAKRLGVSYSEAAPKQSRFCLLDLAQLSMAECAGGNILTELEW